MSAGTAITWRAPPDESGFRIDFPEATPSADGRQSEWTSEQEGDRHRVVITAGEVPGRYKYGIEANGIIVDPAIIIR